MQTHRCVIVAGAPIGRYDVIRSLLRPDDFVICCDCGLRHLEALGVRPSLVVGDFDSTENPHMDVETIVLPCEKDDTDSVYAVREAVRRGFEDFLLVGAVGGRLDHTLGNVAILLYLDGLGKRGVIADDESVMEVVSRAPARIPDGSCAYFSLLNVDGSARGITIRNAKYPLENGVIPVDYQYGISNEVLPGKTAEVTVREGRVLLVRVRGEMPLKS